jgi:hypothetical protein
MLRTVQMMMHEALKRHFLNSQKELFLDFPEAAYAMQNALKEHPIDNLEFLVFADSCLHLDEVLKPLNQQKSVMLVLPMQLGIDKMTPEYLPSLKYTFQMPSTLGFAGGQAKRSFYFTGLVNPHVWDDPYLTYLDPHFVQEAVKDASSMTA